MLYITRKEAESIVITSEMEALLGKVEVQIVKIEEDGVRIGVRAPRDVSVYRYEVFKRIMSANQAAARSRRSAKSISGLMKESKAKAGQS